MSEPFDFESAPSPPAGYSEALQWDHRDWKKLGGGKYVLAREVRESFLDCRGIWPTLDAPALLDRKRFAKFCFYAEKREHQTGDAPEGYIPIAFEENEEDREEWKQRQLKVRFREQYVPTRYDALFGGRIRLFGKGSESDDDEDGGDPMENVRNQRYSDAVVEGRPDLIRELFKRGTSDLDPNCIDGFGKERLGVVASAIHNLMFSGVSGAVDDEGNPPPSRSDALECLRLVCSLDGADTSMDTWYGEQPPIVRTIVDLDVEAVKILLDAGARVSFPDVKKIEDQWVNIVPPCWYPKHYQTALHICVIAPGCSPRHDSSEAIDEDMKAILELLLEAGADPLQGAQISESDDDVTALELLERRQERENESYPRSLALLKEATEKKIALLAQSSYISSIELMDLSGTSLANITDLGEDVQRKISLYIDVFKWRLLRQTCKGLSVWPKPPPLTLNYQLVSFMVSDGSSIAYYGVSKTLGAVVDAFKYIASIDEEVNTRFEENGEISITVEYIRLDVSKNRIIPILQYRTSDYYEDPGFSEVTEVGKKYCGVEAIDLASYPFGSPEGMRPHASLNGQYGGINLEKTDGEETEFELHVHSKAAMKLVEGMQPATDVDLRHLGTIEWNDEDYCVEYHVVWFDPDRYNKGHPGNTHVDPEGQWVVFDETSFLSHY